MRYVINYIIMFIKLITNFQIEYSISIKEPEAFRTKSLVLIVSFLTIYSFVYILDLVIWHFQYNRIESWKIFLKDYAAFYIFKYIILNEILLFCHMVYFIKIRLIFLNDYLYTTVVEKMGITSKFKNGEIKVLLKNPDKETSYTSKFNFIKTMIIYVYSMTHFQILVGRYIYSFFINLQLQLYIFFRILFIG